MTLSEFLALRRVDRRVARLTHDIVLPKARGIELGASCNPVPHPDGFEVVHVDHAVDANAGIGGAVRVDHAWDGGVPLSSLCGDGFDFAIAAQVAQYVPNLLGWLRGIHDVLRPGGVLNISLPDRRFMFDAGRDVSTVGELVEADLMRLCRPSPRQVFNHVYEARAVDPSQFWSGDIEVDDLARYCGEHALALAFDESLRAHETAHYASCHCWVFTPFSFLDAMEAASRLRLTPFVLSQFAATDVGDCEFYACLRRDIETEPASLLSKQIEAIGHLRRIAQTRQRAAYRLSHTR